MSSNIKISMASSFEKPLQSDTYRSIMNNNMEQSLSAFIASNAEPLSKVYNMELDVAKEQGWDALVLMHDDIKFEYDFRKQLEILLERYDLIGVAGTSKATLKSPALWHLMSDPTHMHGCVAHFLDDHGSKVSATNFGPYPEQVIMIDGLFMAMNRTVIENYRFDETNPAKFHFYDLDFSLTCAKSGVKVGVGDIMLKHKSPGLKEFTPEWRAGEQWFLEKHN